MSKDFSPEEFEEQEIHLRDYLQIIYKRRYVILTVLGIVFFTIALKTYSTTPIYTAAAQVLIERNYGSKGLESSYYHYEPEFLETQAEIIKSTNVARKVVDSLQLATRYRQYFFQDKVEVSFLQAAKNSVRKMLDPIFVLLRPGKGEAADDAGTGAIVVAPKSDEEIIAMIIQGGLDVTPVKNTKIVSISYSDANPAMAQMVADAVVQAYMSEMLEIKLSSSSYSVKWMTDKAREEREKLEHAEAELARFMRDNDLVTVEDKMTVLPQKLSGFGSQISSAESEKKELQDQLSQIRAAGNDLEQLERIPALATNEVLKNIRERIYKANQTIQELSKKYGHKHPKMIKARDELRILNDEKRFEIERLISSISNSYELASSKEKSLKDLLNDTKSQMLNMNEKFMQYQILKREVDSNRVMYETLQSGIKQESVTEQSQSVNIWVTKKAEHPYIPSYPNKRRSLALGLVLGLFSGIGLAFFIEYLDNTVKGTRDLEDKFGVTVLGTIEELRSGGEKIESIVTAKPLSPVAESYRLIRSGLLLSSAEHPPRTLLITSMNEKEGKTTTTANIGRILAQSGAKVLIVDCDLRRPRLHEVFGVTSKTGLSSILSGTASDDPVLQIPGEDVSILTSGPIPPAPAELLYSKAMMSLLERMSERFDFILLDSPPIQSVTDSLGLSQYVDGTVVVVRAGKTTIDSLESGMKKLRDVNTRFLGFVLNGMKDKDVGRYNYYGYSSYYAKE